MRYPNKTSITNSDYSPTPGRVGGAPNRENQTAPALWPITPDLCDP